MRVFVYIFVCISIIALSFSAVVGIRWWHVRSRPETTFQAQQSDFKLVPPVDAITTKVVSLSGLVETEPRDQEELITVTSDTVFQEGDVIQTAENGTVTLGITPEFTITIGVDSLFSFSSTDPAHFLFKQDQGTITYATSQSAQRIAVRSLHSLIEVNQGTAIISTNPDIGQIEIFLTDGTASIGYIDTANVTQTRTISAGTRIIFDDAARTITER